MSGSPLPPHWGQVAYQWHHYGSPLRPCADDVRVMEAWVRAAYARGGARPLRVLLWGVTPEIVAMEWPHATQLSAVDRSEAMIDVVWPGDVAGYRHAVCADWFEYPPPGDRYDVVIGDGNFTILDYPDDYRMLAAKARSALADDGMLVTRFFVVPPTRETPATVFDDLLSNRIRSFHAFKFRLAMALQEDAQSGVRMGDVYSAWSKARIDIGALIAMTGWRAESVDTIRLYERKDSRLSFPDTTELDAVLGPHFDKIDERYPGYEMGDRCPIVAYRPRLVAPQDG